MLGRKKQDNELDIKKINDSVSILHKILKIGYILFIILAIYTFIILSKELKILDFVLVLLKVVSPLFIGIVVAWLFNPFVVWLGKKKVKRIYATLIAYFLLIGGLAIIIWSFIPILQQQANDFARAIPQIFDTIKVWIDGLFSNLDSMSTNFDAIAIKNDLFKTMEEFGSNLTSSIPDMIVATVTAIFSGIGVIIIGLVIGFYLLISFDGTDPFISFLPKRIQNTASELLMAVDNSLRTFVQGALLDSTFVFIITSIGFSLVGLKAPLLFGMFCGITNVIPYAGPYIGGFPAVIVGFSQGITTGLLTLLVVAIIQGLEGTFIQPLIMSKTTKLHPVTIMLGLLIFGYFFGILGMLISTPLIASFKAIIIFFDEKYNFLSFND